MRKLLFILCVTVSASCYIYAAAWLFAGQRQKVADQSLANRFQLTANQLLPENNGVSGNNEDVATEISNLFDELLAINPDVAGWIKIDGTAIDYPVLQNGDNAYYLSHNLYKRQNKHGAIFLDFRCKWDSDKIIYGHHMKDNTMFHDLTRYKDEIFRREHDTIILYNIQGNREVYRIVDVLYRNPAFSSQELSLYEYLVQLKDNYPERPLLYLSTCDGSAAEARLIVVACKEPDIVNAL